MTDEELLGRGLRKTKPGDTFSKVARNSGVTVTDIMALNPEVDPARLWVGQILRIREE
jgi:LysM repeat protein